MMPRHAIRSGHCHLVFDISAVGKPQNIRLKTCTDVVFADGAKAVVAIWEYLPAMEGGRAVIRKNVETKLSFRLADERGNLIPEPDSFADDPRHAIDFIEEE
jgi:protein TonB